jgi:hypothetical protein
VDSIKSKKQHAKTILAGNVDSNVVYCENCNVLELNLGGLTLRLNPESLHALSSVLTNATVSLDKLQNVASDTRPAQPAGFKIVH